MQIHAFPQAERRLGWELTATSQRSVFNAEPVLLLPPDPEQGAGSKALSQLNRTYSKSAACLLMPIGGGAIQFAYLPVSTTRPISDAT